MSNAMDQERELDQLLSQWLTGRQVSAPESLQPLLTAANMLTPLRQATPSAAFAPQAEASMLRRAHELVAGESSPDLAPLASRSSASSISRRRASSARRFVWVSGIAAILLLSVGGVFIAGAGAQPGGVLYAVHRFEQGVQAQLTTNAADRVRLHLNNAQAALKAFDTAVARQQHGAELTDALDTFVAEHAAAGAALSAVTDTPSRSQLAAALEQQQSQGVDDLRGALAGQDWSLRIWLTQALGTLNVAIPIVTRVVLTETSDPADSRGGGRITTVTITGAGFEPGAQLLLRGAPAGVVISISSDTLVAQVRAAAQAIVSQGSIGLGNPDGTAALGMQAPVIISGPHPTPPVVPTKNGDNGKHKGTPTPSP